MEEECFVAANSSQASKFPPAKGQIAIEIRLLQSYKWDANSCFIDATMEALFRAFVFVSDAVRAEFLCRIRTEGAKTGLQDVMEHFWLRGLLSGAIPSKDHQKCQTAPTQETGWRRICSRHAGVCTDRAKPDDNSSFNTWIWNDLRLKSILCISFHGSGATVTSLLTEWPLFLRVVPIWTSRIPAEDSTTLDLYCPLTMNLGSDVEYKLISQVIYLGNMHDGSVGHYYRMIESGNARKNFDGTTAITRWRSK
ncbi:hypothetical protein B0H10DRAFT_1965316 [Mycena sp. CBHHK59/15]|nr:hypothetical protein B0H10DRAFT_1965316 [Mycena sp. CBHHK59/15]